MKLWIISARSVRIGALCLGLALPIGLRATIPEPDNLVFGAVDPAPYRARTRSIQVEVRRGDTGRLIGMAEPTEAGGFSFVVAVPTEAWAPLSGADAALAGQPLRVLLKIDGQIADDRTATVGARGELISVDFAGADADGDGLTDSWENQFFGGIAADPNADPDGDLLSNRDEFLRGTNPVVKDARHSADLSPADDRITISEITSYAVAWKTGEAWSLAPSPIPIEYLTRAAGLWKGGEVYRLDPTSTDGPPLWWINAAPPAALASVRQSGVHPLARRARTAAADDPTSSQSGRAIRVVTGAGGPGAVLVAVQVEISTNINAWAVEETLPEGWTASQISGDGAYVKWERKVKWGPYYSASVEHLTYRLEGSASSSELPQLEGTVSWDGIDMRIVDQSGGGPGELPPRFELSVANQVVTIRVKGLAKTRYAIEACEMLGVWELAGEVTTDAAGEAVHTEMVSSQSRFFRVRQPY